jgi:hypothetical protein
MKERLLVKLAVNALLALFVTACSDGGSTVLIGGSVQSGSYLISGTMTGLAAGRQITLLNNGADPTVLSSNGVFTFATPVIGDGTYSVTVGAQPTGAICTVSGGSGTGVTSNITSISVTCSAPSFSIGGTVSGLGEGQQVTLLNNGVDSTTIAADGAFEFAMPVPFNGSYAITVEAQSVGQTCTVSGGSGAGVTANVTAVRITCSTTGFSIGGTVTGLAEGQHLTLLNNGSDAIAVAVNGTFTFPTAVASNGGYSVTVGTQPTGQTCTVSGGAGEGVIANVTGVSVVCSTNTFMIGGSVSGLGDDEQVTLYDNGSDATIVAGNQAFTFATPVAYDGGYSVTVGTQPTGQTCTVSGGSGTGVTANVTTVAVTCSTNTFTIGGSVSGLATGQQVTLFNNGADAKTVTTNGNFTFTVPVAYNGSYSVTVSTQPTGQTCTVTSGSGTGVTADITGVAVDCVTATTFSVSGTITGLDSGRSLTILNNNANPVTYSANGSFTFLTGVADNGSYSLSIGTQPLYQLCELTNGSASGVTANATNVSVDCFDP